MSDLDNILDTAAQRWKASTDESIRASRYTIVASATRSSLFGKIIVGVAVASSAIALLTLTPLLFRSTTANPVLPRPSESTQPAALKRGLVEQLPNTAPVASVTPAGKPVVVDSSETLKLRRRSSSQNVQQLESLADSIARIRPSEAVARYRALANRYERAGDTASVQRLRAKAINAELSSNP